MLVEATAAVVTVFLMKGAVLLLVEVDADRVNFLVSVKGTIAEKVVADLMGLVELMKVVTIEVTVAGLAYLSLSMKVTAVVTVETGSAKGIVPVMEVSAENTVSYLEEVVVVVVELGI